jgi:hypothetical protein
VNGNASWSKREKIMLYNNFVRDVEMEHLNVLGRRSSWYHPNGRSMSCIDTVLISEDWVPLWGQSSLWVLPKDVSDHCSLVLKYKGWDWGLRPF